MVQGGGGLGPATEETGVTVETHPPIADLRVILILDPATRSRSEGRRPDGPARQMPHKQTWGLVWL